VTANLDFVPSGFNEDVIRDAGLNLVVVHDRTDAVAGIASRWGAARERNAEAVKRQEGDDWFARRQRMLAAAAELARTHRLSRFVYLAEKSRLVECHLRRRSVTLRTLHPSATRDIPQRQGPRSRAASSRKSKVRVPPPA
jgi:hypothetical protein